MLMLIYKRSIAFILFSLIAPTSSWAAMGEEGFVMGGILMHLINLLNHGITRLCFVLAIIGVGYGWLYLGKIPKDRAVGAIVGVGLIFSSSYIARQLGVI